MILIWLSKYACLALVFASGVIAFSACQRKGTVAKTRGPAGAVLRQATWRRRAKILLAAHFAPGLSVACGCRNFFPFRVVLKHRRQKLLERQLPDALELAGNRLQAGFSLLQTLEAAARDAPRPTAEIFRDTVRDIRLGLSAEEALLKNSLAWRHEDLTWFAAAAAISNRTGASLAALAGRLVQTMRERRQWQGRISAVTAQARLSGWIVGLLPFGLLAALGFLEPGLLQGFFQQPLAWAMLACCLALEALGLIWIRRIMRIEV